MPMLISIPKKDLALIKGGAEDWALVLVGIPLDVSQDFRSFETSGIYTALGAEQRSVVVVLVERDESKAQA